VVHAISLIGAAAGRLLPVLQGDRLSRCGRRSVGAAWSRAAVDGGWSHAQASPLRGRPRLARRAVRWL